MPHVSTGIVDENQGSNAVNSTEWTPTGNAILKRSRIANSSVYSPDATLTHSSPKGVTRVVHGIDPIIRFYQGIWAEYHGYQWTQESMRSLDSNVVLSYERAGTQQLAAGRCVHLFVVQNGKIMSLYWVVYQ